MYVCVFVYAYDSGAIPLTGAGTFAAITKDKSDLTVRNRDGTFPEAAIAAKEETNKCVILCVYAYMVCVTTHNNKR